MALGSLNSRIKIVTYFLIFGLLGMGVRFYFVQVVRHDELYSKARKIVTYTCKKKGKRGEIFDVNGCLLAANLPCFDVTADPQESGSDEECMNTAEFLSPILGIPTDKIFSLLTKRLQRNGRKNKYVLLKKLIPLDSAEIVKKVIAENKIKGIALREKSKRFYPNDYILAQTLGFTNIDRDKIIPQSGLERTVAKDVAGRVGEVRAERDRKGRTLSYGYKHIQESENGKNVYLTINVQLQIIVEEELDKLYSKFKPRAAYAIMVNPKNGNIMAMAQRPTFNPNDRSTIKSNAVKNRMITDIFEPGSTMKPFVISTALDYGFVRPWTKIDCEMGHWSEMKLNDAHKMGLSSVTEILVESSNIGTGKIALNGQK